MAESRLWEALDTLRNEGWFQGSSVCQGATSGNKKVGKGYTCLYIALHRAHDRTDSNEYLRDVAVLRDVCLEYFPERTNAYSCRESTLIQVNNHSDTTYGDIEMLLEKAAIRADEVLS